MTVNRLPTGTHWFAKRTSLSNMAEDLSDQGRTGFMVSQPCRPFKAKPTEPRGSRRPGRAEVGGRGDAFDPAELIAEASGFFVVFERDGQFELLFEPLDRADWL